MKLLDKALAAVRNNRGVAVAMAFVMAPAAFAQTSSIDTSSVVNTITTDGLAAVGAIGAAWLTFKYVKKVWNRI